jgi:hypothetical protein
MSERPEDVDKEHRIEESLLEAGESAENPLEFAPSGVPKAVFDVVGVLEKDEKAVTAF